MGEIESTTDYGLYIMESDDDDNDDWVGDHDHPKDCTITDFTEGTDYIFLPYSGKLEQVPEFVFDIMDFFNGAGVDISLGEGHWLYKAEGRFGGTSETTRNTKMGNLLKFFMKHLKSTDETIYLGYRKVGEVWEPFVNDSETVKYYAKGKLIHASYSREEGKNYYNWKIIFRVMW